MKKNEEEIETEHLTEQWREKNADILTPDEAELRNQTEAKEKTWRKTTEKKKHQTDEVKKQDQPQRNNEQKMNHQQRRHKKMKTIHETMENNPRTT